MNCTDRVKTALNLGRELPPDCIVFEWRGSYFVENNEIVCSLMECFVVPGPSLGGANVLEWIVTLLALLVLWVAGLTLVSLVGKNKGKNHE